MTPRHLARLRAAAIALRESQGLGERALIYRERLAPIVSHVISDVVTRRAKIARLINEHQGGKDGGQSVRVLPSRRGSNVLISF